MQALVQTFHIDRAQLADVTEGLDEALERFSQNPNFGGLLCLGRDGGLREQVTVVVFWSEDAIDQFAPEVEDAHEHIAATTDLGVSSVYHRVLRFVPGSRTVQLRFTRIA